MKNKKSPLKISDFSSYSLICRVLMSLAVYLLISCIFTFTLYIAGNFQNFTDQSQIFLLTTLTVLSIMMLVSSLSGLISNIVFLIAKVRISHRIVSIIVFIFIIILGIIFLLFSTVLTRLASGLFSNL